MPKMKSHSGTKKRFRKTGTGKLMRQETEIAAADRKVIKSRLA